MPARRLPLTVLSCVFGAALLAAQTPTRTITQSELFTPTKVWTAHLTFTPEQWAAITPVRGPGNGRSRNENEWLQGRDGRRNGFAAVRGIEFNYVHADLEFDGVRFRDVAVRYKGNGTFVNAMSVGKFSLKIDFNKYAKGQKIAGISTLNFHNNIEDTSWMNEPVAYRLYRDAGVPSPRTSYTKVYITVPGRLSRAYSGLYTIVENVDTNFVEARFKSDEGPIYKPVTGQPFTDLGGAWARYVQAYDPKTDLTMDDEQRMIAFCKLVSGARDPEFMARVGEYVDLDEFSRYLTVAVWINDIDGILDRGQNFYVHVDPSTKRMRFMPWDMDHAFGGFARVQPGNYAEGSITRPWTRSIRFLERMFTVPEFKQAYFARMREYSGTIFQPARFSEQVRELSGAIRATVVGEATRVQGFERVAAGQSGLLPFVTDRARSVNAQLAKIR